MGTNTFHQVDTLKKVTDEKLDTVLASRDCGCSSESDPAIEMSLAELEAFYDRLITITLEIERQLEELARFSKKVNSFEFQDKFKSVTDSLLSEEYTQIAAFIGFSIFLSIVIVAASYYLVTQKPEVEKLSTYECGFEPYEDAKNKFDVQFYIVAILFVLFDIEIIVLSPWCLCLSNLDTLSYWSVFEFLLELGLGLVYVICLGALNWKKAIYKNIESKNE